MAGSVLRSTPINMVQFHSSLFLCVPQHNWGGGRDNDGGWEEGQQWSHMEAIRGAFIQKSIKVLVALKLK